MACEAVTMQQQGLGTRHGSRGEGGGLLDKCSVLAEVSLIVEIGVTTQEAGSHACTAECISCNVHVRRFLSAYMYGCSITAGESCLPFWQGHLSVALGKLYLLRELPNCESRLVVVTRQACPG